MEFQSNTALLCKLSSQISGMAPTKNKNLSKICGLWSFLLAVQEYLVRYFPLLAWIYSPRGYVLF